MKVARWLTGTAAAVLAVGLGAGPAAACGFLVAPNGAVDLIRTTTLASWSDGVEHYVTSFEFASEEPSFGSIIPLPSEPTNVERGGDWTLQRLRREIPGEARTATEDGAATTAAAASAQVIREVQIDALNITVLKGGGKEVVEWANNNGFDLHEDVTRTLEHYSATSPYFMAARFDADRANASRFRTGDGIPIHIEMPLDRPWVPLQILAAAKPASELVEADVFLLTPAKPKLGALDKGVTVEKSARATSLLLNDLRNDQNSSWIPQAGYLTHVAIKAKAGDMKRDLVTQPAETPKAPQNDPGNGKTTTERDDPARYAAVALGGVLLGAIVVSVTRRRPTPPAPPTPPAAA
jgi:Uncharacterized protein conserved in bacteria (DUF2330)